MNPFHMESEARARAVAKQLRSNLHFRGINLSLGKSLDATARLYGHADWRTLTASIGKVRSGDDALVAGEERSIRHIQQRSVLVGLGLSPDVAEDVRAALSPTGRSERDAEVAAPVILKDTVSYHPVRFMDEVESLARCRMFLELSEQGKQPTSAESVDLETPSYPLVELAEDVIDHIEDAAVIPLDDDAFDEDAFIGLYGEAQCVIEGRGVLLDASLRAGELAAHDVAEVRYAGAWDGMPKTYVHLGTNAFPSPFPFAGIEGCYVTIDVPTKDGEVRRVEVTFVASPETVPGLGLRETLTIDRRDAMLWNTRTVSLSIDTEDPLGEIRIGDIPSARSGGERSDEYVDLWRPYLASPLNAAWNALHANREGKLQVRDGVHEDVPSELVRKLVRARTPEMRHRAIRAIAEEGGEVVVRLLGGLPSTPEPGEADGPPTGVDAKVDDPRAWSEAYFRMAREADLPEAAMRFSERALGVLESQNHRVSDAERAQYHLLRETALSVRGRWEDALSEGLKCLRHDPEGATRMLVRLPALCVRANDEPAAREAIGRMGLTPVEAAWSKALVAARFGSTEERDAAIAIAVELDPESAAKLVGPVPRQRASERDIDCFRGEPASIASMHRQGWEAIEGYREIIKFAFSGHEPTGMRH